MKIKLGLSTGIKVGSIGVSRSGATADTTRPTVAITSTASVATAGAFTCTFTFSEAVIGFDATKITVSNGTAGAVAGTGPYTSVITPTKTGTVTVTVADGAVADGAGNTNTVSNTFSILYIAALTWFDFSTTTGLYQTRRPKYTRHRRRAIYRLCGRYERKQPQRNAVRGKQAGLENRHPEWSWGRIGQRKPAENRILRGKEPAKHHICRDQKPGAEWVRGD